MSGNLSSPNPIQPLSVGNVVSAGLRLYRSHLKEYFLLALKAYVWVVIPFYGWAKCYAISALIARLAFGDLVNQPESINSGERFVNSRLWQFLLTLLLMFLITIGIGISFAVLFFVIGLLSAGIFTSVGQQQNLSMILIFVLIGIVVSVMVFIVFLWLVSRFYLVDVPLAIEDNVNSTSTFGRSWELTQGHVGRIFLISFVAFLITLPIRIVVQILSIIIQRIFLPLLDNSSPFFYVLYFVLIVGLILFSSAAVLPFWQSIKAVIYYDLRSRREGLGLQLRDREI